MCNINLFNLFEIKFIQMKLRINFHKTIQSRIPKKNCILEIIKTFLLIKNSKLILILIYQF